MKEMIINPEKLDIQGFIWIDGEKWAVICRYILKCKGVDPYDIEYYLCLKPDGKLQLIDTESATFHKDTKEVRKWMKELNKKRDDLKRFEGNLFIKLFGDYNF